jgi:signal transduction histidine kinase/CheY-like chemotaxis protein
LEAPKVLDFRCLIWAGGRDAALTCSFLREAGFDAVAVGSWADLRDEIERGAGVLIIAGELLQDGVRAEFEVLLRRQPPWSDLPVVVVAGDAAARHNAQFYLENVGTVSLLNRPLSPGALASTVGAALRARRKQYEVRDLLRQREESERRREEFLAMLAHELRNPLAPIRTGLQVLRVTESKDVVSRTYTIMERQVAHLSRLIDDLLDVSRITRGKIVLQRQKICLQDSLQQAADAHAKIAAEKGLKISVLGAERKLYVDADVTRLEQMIGNVLGNAIKFTPANGSIDITVSDEGEQVIVRVKDTGIGIPPTMLSRIFDLFAQTDRSLDRSQGGLGIGLTVVKALAELHGGSCSAFSAGEGKGTEIVIRLPRAEAPEVAVSDLRRLSSVEQSLRRVLVIEDNREAAESLAMYLRACGHTVHIAYDGVAGMDAAVRERPDVVICDIGLPGVNGYELARLLRQHPELQRCMLVAVTGYGEPRDRVRGMEAGFQHYFTKPADPTELAKLVGMTHPQRPGLQ